MMQQIWNMNKKAASQNWLNRCFYYGTRDENRTRTGLLPRDFKSLASTSSATRAWCPILVIPAVLSIANLLK